VFSDSESGIHLNKNNVYHSNTTHISIEYHYIKDTIVAGDIVMNKAHTTDNHANMLT